MSRSNLLRRALMAASGSALLLGTLAAAPAVAQPPQFDGVLFTQSNDATGNDVLVFGRMADGSLVEVASYATGGAGTGVDLGSQGAVIRNNTGDVVLAVDAGSDELSIFRARGTLLRLFDTESSGGDMPISVTTYGHVAYVVNAGDDTISGFTIGEAGLTSIAGSTRSLSNTASGPAQIEFTPDGAHLVVTQKNTNVIDVFPVDADGVAGEPVSTASTGATPFGFAFDPAGRLIVSNAAGGAVDASSLTSYEVNGDGTLPVLDGPEPTTETAACWVVVTADGRYTYTTNTGSNSISGFAIGEDGSLTLLDPDGVTAATGAAPIDMALSGDGQFLYNVNAAGDSLSGFRVEADGSLTPLFELAGLPTGTVGLAGS